MSERPAAASAVAMAISLPTVCVLAVVLASFATPDREVLAHLWSYVLPRVLPNTLALVACVGLGATALGTVLAWLVTAYEFPGRRWFAWALVLPMALPGYVLAFVFLGVFDYTGPVQSALRAWTGLAFDGDWLRGLPGLTLVLTVALFPYVYLLARAAFATLGRDALEAAASLGAGPRTAFLRVALPMARPWILGGTLLVVMETLADFGTVSVFNYDTFTTAIYKSWFGLFSLEGALNLSSVLLLLVLAAVLIERRFAHARRFATGSAARPRRVRLEGAARWAAVALPGAVLAIGLVLPLIQLLLWAFGPALDEWTGRYWHFAARSLALAAMAAALVCAVALALGYAVREHRRGLAALAARIATLGYALPGTVLAVGVFVPVAALGAWLESLAPGRGAQALQGTLVVMLGAYLIRFLAVGFGPVDNGMLRLTRDVDEAARLHGVRGPSLLARVHWPVLRGSVFAAAALVFVDVMKEMPITLMTRPRGWETLAVRIFEKTAEGQWEAAAPAALAIVAVGLVPVALLGRGGARAT